MPLRTPLCHTSHEPLPSHRLVSQQLQAEQEEEYITNRLMKRLETLKQEKEALEAMRRAEQALFVSFSRHRGSVVATPSQILSPTSV